ncbi:hypothetical protein BaRGS_00018764 [Batillaria attramentaria]|uniref:Integrase catalytic domain-containing protein n=1 Tax=Batillaria attramentaria TaxID=370345 RepID=A0ABD0KS74_9CAEN
MCYKTTCKTCQKPTWAGVYSLPLKIELWETFGCVWCEKFAAKGCATQNIPREALKVYIANCWVCQQKAVRHRTFPGKLLRCTLPTVGCVSKRLCDRKPILTKEVMSRAQIDLIDYQSMPDGNYKWLLVLKDHLTKFCVLRPMTSKHASEVATQLVDMSCIFEAPAILQSLIKQKDSPLCF